MLLTLSMPSTLVAHQNNPSSFPPLATLLDIGRGLENYRPPPKGEKEVKTEVDQRQRVNRLSNLSVTSRPGEMNGVDGSSILPPNIGNRHHHGGSVFGSSVPPYPTPQNKGGSHAQQKSRIESTYNSYYTTQQRSPTVKKETESSTQQVARRRASNDANAIASHLQIPPSINNSKGSLPEFAAQVGFFFIFFYFFL